MVEGVHGGVLHDGLDPFLLGELYQFAAGGGVGEIFCRGGEEELILEVFGKEPVPGNLVPLQWERRDGCPHPAGWRSGWSGTRLRSQ